MRICLEGNEEGVSYGKETKLASMPSPGAWGNFLNEVGSKHRRNPEGFS